MDFRLDIDRRNRLKGLVCLYFCSNTQHSTLVFPGIFLAASLPLVLPATGLTLSQKKSQIFLQLPLIFLFSCTFFEEEYCCKTGNPIHNQPELIYDWLQNHHDVKKKVEHILNLSPELENWGQDVKQSLRLHGKIYMHFTKWKNEMFGHLLAASRWRWKQDLLILK